MTTPADLHRREVARLSRIIANPHVTAFEHEAARVALDRLQKPLTCPHCLDAIASHNGAKCPVVDRFQRRNGRGTYPTEGQASELRTKIAAEEAAREKGERKRETKGRQGSLF